MAEEKLVTPATEVMTITEAAAKKIKEFLAAENKGPEFGLRIGVQGGGCSGFQYFMELDTARPDDKIVERDGAKLFIDPKSTMHVRGSQIDFVNDLHGSGFKIGNPNVKGSCGCGHSFQT